MSSDSSTNPPSPSHRRSSFTPSEPALSSVFGRSNSQAGTSSMPGTLAASRRRMSISTLGLSGTSPTSASPWSATAAAIGRRGSMSSAGTSASAIDENAVEDGEASVPSTPFARRLSFGPRALRDPRAGSTNSGSPTNKQREGGFNWSESLRAKAETQADRSLTTRVVEDRAAQRAASIATMPSQPAPVSLERKEDHFQDRILKGEFMMD
ncbi:MAG: hypothetical protein M1814_006368 [Vezdaea aestivalis]|nr:MAG: hypothetical protein M1814_006368 [Vezdaea aestivalis]